MTETGQSSDLLVAITRLRDATVDAGCAAPFAGEPEAQTTVRLYNQLLQLRQARALYCQATGNDRFFFDPAPEEREREFEILQEAVTAFAAGRLHLAVWRGVSACALDPNDEHAVLLTDRALGALRGAASPPDSDARRRFQPRPPRHVSHARAFVAIADADEVGADAQMLRAWTSTFAPEDQATLAIVTPPSELEATQQRLVQVLPGAGLSVDTEYDLAIIACPRERLPELVREAHARFTGSGPSRDARLDGLPGFGVDPASLVALRAAAQRRWSYAGAGRALRIVIKIPAHGWEEAAGWGDTFFAQQFAEALTLRGHAVALEVVPEWDQGPRPGSLGPPPSGAAAGTGHQVDVVVHLRGPYPYVPQPGCFNVLWNISRPSRVTRRECDAFDLIAAPSARRAQELASITSTPVMVLPQATDPANCWPEFDPEFAHQLSFVANTRGVHRQIMRDLLPTPHDLAVWGAGWRGLIPDRCIKGESLNNDQLRRAYSSAELVLNDHMDDQRRHGIINNRIYDVLACGGCVLSDHLPELDAEFGGIVATYRTPEDLRATVGRLLADPDERAERAARGRELVLRAHTFADRAQTLLEAVSARL